MSRMHSDTVRGVERCRKRKAWRDAEFAEELESR